jgi:transcriptional regulator with XRE-family HTH domain
MPVETDRAVTFNSFRFPSGVLDMATRSDGFGEWLLEQRTRAKLTMPALGLMADTSHTHINDIEKGKRNGGPELRQRLIDALEERLQEIEDDFDVEAFRRGAHLAARTLPPDALDYVTDADTAEMVRYFRGLPQEQKQRLKGAAKSAADFVRELEEVNTFGKRADRRDAPSKQRVGNGN